MLKATLTILGLASLLLLFVGPLVYLADTLGLWS